MKNVLVLVFFFCGIGVYAQQVTLYDQDSSPRAYIDYGNGSVIFRFDGTPVAFLGKNEQMTGVFDFEGNFIGWFTNGIVYNHRGNMVAKTEEAMDGIVPLDPAKGFQKSVPAKPPVTFVASVPVFSNRWISELEENEIIKK
jgi:hypothetical protein